MSNDRINILHKAGGVPMPVQKMSITAGLSVREIALKYHGSTHGIIAFQRGVESEWVEIPVSDWGFIPDAHCDVMFTHRLHGGDSKSIFATIAAIALAIFAPAILASLGPIVGTAVVIGANLLLSALFTADTPVISGVGGSSVAEDEGQASQRYANVSTDSNVLARDAYLPSVLGTRRIAPPDVVQPHAYLEGDVQVLERVLAVKGYHSLSNVQINKTSITDDTTVLVETRDGQEQTGTYTFVDKISVPNNVSSTLESFRLNGVIVVDTITPSNSEPKFINFATPNHPHLDEINIRMTLSSFYRTSTPIIPVLVPLRIQIRPKGGDENSWIYIPEIHIKGAPGNQPRPIELRFRFDNDFGSFSTGNNIQYDFWQQVPEVTEYNLSDGSTGVQWQADASFVSGAGLQDVTNIVDRKHGVRIVIPESLKGAMEWRVKRGLALDSADIDASYEINSIVESLFLSRDDSGWRVPILQNDLLPAIALNFVTTIADTPPVQDPETAVVALRSFDHSFEGVTVEAAKYINDYNTGAGTWTDSTATSNNPASHYRHVLFEALTRFGIDTDLIDDASFVAWRQECIDRGYELNLLIAGESIIDTLDLIATAGLAIPRYSDGFGVDYFRDRSADTPKQTFSARNSSDISFVIGKPEKPFGFRIKFNNEDDEFRADEMNVTTNSVANFNGYETISYRGITKPGLVFQRGYFDLLQLNHRTRKWSVDTSIEGVICEKGDLVSIVTDLFNDDNHGVRIKQVVDSTTLVLDVVIPIVEPPNDFGDTPEPSVADVLDVGLRSNLIISTPTGDVEREIVNANGNTVILDSALPSTDVLGAHGNIFSDQSHRCFVVDVKRDDETNSATVTLVDEAPEIWQKMNEKFG